MKTKFFLFGFLSAILIIAFSGAVFASKQYSKSFSDVNEEDWFYSAVMDLSEEGLINGYTDGTFGVGKSISREEAAKLFYLTNLRIAKLENDIENKVDEEEVADEVVEETVDTSESEEVTIIEEEGNADEEQIVLNIVTDLTKDGTMPDGYSVFEETLKKFKVYYPSVYFWNNSIGEGKIDEGYLWYTEFSKDDFASNEDAFVKFAVSIAKPAEINSDREVLIFVKRDETTSYLVEGDLEDMKDLQKIAVSFKNIQ